MSIDKESNETRPVFDGDSGVERELLTAMMPAASPDKPVEVIFSPVPTDTLPPFEKDLVGTPKVMVHKQPNPFPISFTGHLPPTRSS